MSDAFRGLIHLARPRQWTKNLICFAGVIFGSHLGEVHALMNAAGAFAAFCAASSAVYAMNDWRDRERDRLHPRKRTRPLASGVVSPGQGIAFGALLAAGSLAAAAVLGTPVFVCIAAYLALNAAYSLGLKHAPILDVTIIAVGFVLRLLGGVLAVPTLPTPWIILCTFFLALFIGFGKRRAELAEAQRHADAGHRPVLSTYNPELLSGLLNITSTLSLVTYALFTVSSGRNPTLVLTVPFAAFVVMHFTRRVTEGSAVASPDELLLQDRTMQVGILLWLAVYLTVLYGNIHLFA